ncbi:MULTISPECIES: PPC domain-containing DNA-binding protein [unclassified Streptomyces]|uniref:PPC domain-containing DNA-binding protein n=1 Tax=unclassified Streptomyces TaxID=2593676 RepID=UPI001661E380|nr:MULTISPECIES: PPC domain-containing DNA-binding protein [unclassified Streptomyces]MBD0841434.1 DNA-binding protein [Streptomyces sp. TRM68416]
MKWQQLADGQGAMHVVVLEPDEEPVQVLTAFARDHGIRSAQITAVGAFAEAVVGWFDREARDYRPIPVTEQCEVLSLVGDIAEGEDGPVPHLHAVLGLADGRTRGGHLLRGRVWPTLEVVVRGGGPPLAKVYDPDVGLALIEPRHRDPTP